MLASSTLIDGAGAFPAVLGTLLADMGGRLALLAEKYRALSVETPRERLADWLPRKSGRTGLGLWLLLPETKEKPVRKGS